MHTYLYKLAPLRQTFSSEVIKQARKWGECCRQVTDLVRFVVTTREVSESSGVHMVGFVWHQRQLLVPRGISEHDTETSTISNTFLINTQKPTVSNGAFLINTQKPTVSNGAFLTNTQKPTVSNEAFLTNAQKPTVSNGQFLINAQKPTVITMHFW